MFLDEEILEWEDRRVVLMLKNDEEEKDVVTLAFAVLLSVWTEREELFHFQIS